MDVLRRLIRTAASVGPNSYCALCLRTTTSRRLVEKHSLMAVINVLNDEEVWPWKNAQDSNLRVCFICEARLVSMLKVVELIRFGVMAEHLLKCYKGGTPIFNKAKDHHLRASIAVCNRRFGKIQIYSDLIVTKTLTINFEGSRAVPIAPKIPNQSLNLPTIDLTDLQSQKQKDPNPSRTTQTKGSKVMSIKEQPNINPLPDMNPLVTHTAVSNSLEFSNSSAGIPVINNTDITQKLQPIIPHVTVPNVIQLESGIILKNSGKYLALKTPGKELLLHAIYQGTDGNSYVPTLSVKIQNGRLTSFPTSFAPSCTQQSLPVVDNNVPLMDISLPGLDKILSDNSTSLSQADGKASGLNQLSGPSSSTLIPFDLNHMAANNRGNLPSVGNQLQTPQANKARPESNVISDLTVITEADYLQNEDPIDVFDEVTVTMEDDPLQQVDLTSVSELVPIPKPIKSENDIIKIDINDDSMDTDDVMYQGTTQLGPLTNTERASIRIDILNGYKKPIVVLERLKMLNEKFLVNPGFKAKATNNTRTFRNKRALPSNQLTKGNLNKPKKGHFSKMMSDVKQYMTVFKNKPLISSKTNNAGQCVLVLDSVKSDSVNVKKESDTTVVLSDSESEADNVKPALQQHVFKIPKMKDGNIDWEDKIPMDVITYMDATDPMSKPPEEILMTPKDETSSSHNSFQYTNDTTHYSCNSFQQANDTTQNSSQSYQQDNNTTPNTTSSLSPYESRYLQEISTDGGALGIIVESYSQRNVIIDTDYS